MIFIKGKVYRVVNGNCETCAMDGNLGCEGAINYCSSNTCLEEVLLRKVEVFKYIRNSQPGQLRKTHDGYAVLHQFGCDYEEFESGVGNFSTAIIEREGGTIENVPVELIRFVREGETDASNL